MTNKLPNAEWNFDSVNPDKMKLAFFYEYSRQSKVIRRKVDIYRELHPYMLPNEFRLALSIDHEKLLACSTAERHRIDMLLCNFEKNSYLYLIDWLSYIQKFPERPFAELVDRDFASGRGLPTNTRGFVDLGWYTPHGSFWTPDIFWDAGHFKKQIEKSKIVHDYQTLHVPLIDWRKSDAELVNDFRDYVKIFRSISKTEAVSESARGIGNDPIDLPKECRKIDTALFHLGKLRCLESCGSWDEYMSLYHPANADRRSLQKDISAARKVLEWLDSKV